MTQAEPKPIANPDGELSVYDDLVLTKNGGMPVLAFVQFLERSPLFLWAVEQKITVVTGFHGSDGDGGMPGSWAAWFSDAENAWIRGSLLAKRVTLKIIEKEEYKDMPDGELKKTVAQSIIGGGAYGGNVFYAWCYSDYMYRHFNSGGQLLKFK